MTTNRDLQQLVAERLRALPQYLQISIGGTSYTPQNLIQSVQNGDSLGQKVMEIQLKYLQDLAHGKIYQDE